MAIQPCETDVRFQSSSAKVSLRASEPIKTLYIDPGCPWQNGYVESFHDKFRRECLARELFYTLSEAMVVIAAWRRKFNHVRPHRSLGMKAPETLSTLLRNKRE